MVLSFPREIGLKRTLCRDKAQWKKYVQFLGSRFSCYTSLYSFDRLDGNRVDYSSVIIDRAWWDFDSGPLGTIEQVKDDVSVLLSRLKGDVRLVATGRGFHVHQLFKEPVHGKVWVRKLQMYENHAARGLKTLDGVGYAEKLTRIPGTYNPKRGRWAIPVDTVAFRASPQGFRIPSSPHADMDRYDPFNGVINGGFDFTRWTKDNRGQIKEVLAAPLESIGEVADVDDIPMIPCLERAANVQNPSHHVRVALVQYMADMLRDFADPATLTSEDKQDIENRIFEYIKSLGWRDFRASRTRQGIRSNMNYKNTPKCSWFIGRNMCPGRCWRYDGS
jgi:hypothetical protein